MIKNYGLFWDVNNIFWGTQNNRGRLLGINAKAKTLVDSVDFSEQAAVYALYADYELIYIGQTGLNNQQGLLSRLRMHRKDYLAERWNKFSWFGFYPVNDNNELDFNNKINFKDLDLQRTIIDQMEAILISISEPPLNRQGGKWGKNVEQYLQKRDEDMLGPKLEIMIKEIWKKSNNFIK